MSNMQSTCELIFVYNATSSLSSQISDIAHKIISPETYRCNLCRITYGNFGARPEWKEFIETLPCKAEFLHSDEFLNQYPAWQSTTFPTVLRMTKNAEMSLLIEAVQINEMQSVEDLKQLLATKLN